MILKNNVIITKNERETESGKITISINNINITLVIITDTKGFDILQTLIEKKLLYSNFNHIFCNKALVSFCFGNPASGNIYSSRRL
jgi:hypothetical protein